MNVDNSVTAIVLCLIFFAIYVGTTIRAFERSFLIGMGCLLVPLVAPIYFFYLLTGASTSNSRHDTTPNP